MEFTSTWLKNETSMLVTQAVAERASAAASAVVAVVAAAAAAAVVEEEEEEEVLSVVSLGRRSAGAVPLGVKSSQLPLHPP